MENSGWAVTVDWEYPAGLFLHPALFDRLSEALLGRGLVLTVPINDPRLGLTFAIERCHSQIAKDVAIQVVDDALARSGLPAGKLTVRRVTSTAELDRQLDVLMWPKQPLAKVLQLVSKENNGTDHPPTAS